MLVGFTNKAIERQQKALEKANATAARQQKYRNQVDGLKSGAERLQNLGQRSMVSGVAMLAPSVAMGKGVIGMTQTAGKFEQLQNILEITEGSSEGAKKSLDWVQQFAVDTPANLDEAAKAFVRLRAYGMDPTNGLLMSLGDTAAAMGNPALRRLEMMTRLNGLEQWAEETQHHALFLTLTAPSTFHATLSHGEQNPKWNGASPRATHQYLNRVWAQFRALLAKRDIGFYGMRVAEPHHDGYTALAFVGLCGKTVS
ncbi:Bacteriophage replication gene A protein (GPA) [[Actinobacillus] rossii]|uniref:Bacteriophage replication gene A protein (GPA) n=1 Tax=[Actinobacillus] rossii TaxID=123820 RepID=A0A380U0Y4_9PAST|nr:Bacteriophage replication gene A protein (GPA) [[Actinobacillus] rossii]